MDQKFQIDISQLQEDVIASLEVAAEGKEAERVTLRIWYTLADKTGWIIREGYMIRECTL